jgi:hypothetical protein
MTEPILRVKRTGFETMIGLVRNRINEAMGTDDPADRERTLRKALTHLDTLEERIKAIPRERGSAGGTKTAERGPDYFRQIAAMRKTRAGGRPRKQKSDT